MSDQNNEATSKSPSHYVYHVRDREGKKGIWTRIGSAWSHGDSKGLSISLDCIPVDGRISVRIASEQKN